MVCPGFLLAVVSLVVLGLTIPHGIRAQSPPTYPTSGPFDPVPAGMRQVLSSDLMPKAVSDAFKSYQANQAAPTSPAISLEDLTRTLNQNNQNGNQQINTTQASLAAANIQVVSAALAFAAGILKVTSASIGTAASALGLPPAEWKRWAPRAQFLNSEYQFGQTLYNDFNSAIDKSDYLGDAAKYIKLWQNLQAALAGGGLSSDAQAQIAQLTNAKALVQTVADNFVTPAKA